MTCPVRVSAQQRPAVEIASAAVAVLGYALVGSIFLAPVGGALLTVSALLTWLAGGCTGQGVAASAARQAAGILGVGVAGLALLGIGGALAGIVSAAAVVLGAIGEGGQIQGRDIDRLLGAVAQADESGLASLVQQAARAAGVSDSQLAAAKSKARAAKVTTTTTTKTTSGALLSVDGKRIDGIGDVPWLVWRLLKDAGGRVVAPPLTVVKAGGDGVGQYATAIVRLADDIPAGQNLAPMVSQAMQKDDALIVAWLRQFSTTTPLALARAAKDYAPLRAYFKAVLSALSMAGVVDHGQLAAILNDPSAAPPPPGTRQPEDRAPVDGGDDGNGGGLGLLAGAAVLYQILK